MKQDNCNKAHNGEHQADDIWPDRFDTRSAAHKYLVARGYTLKQRTFYHHVKTGLVPCQKISGSRMRFTRSGLDQYARLHLGKFAPTELEERIREGDLSTMQARKLAADTRKAEAEAEFREFKLEVEKGRYIHVEQFERELAARMIVLRAGFANMIALCLDDWIAALQDDPVKGRAFMREAIIENYHELLYEYARLPEWTVEFTNDPDRKTKS